MDDFERSIEKFRNWLNRNFDGTGHYVRDPGNSRYYMKLPYIFHMLGEKTKGARVAQYVLENFIDSSGRLDTPGLTDEVRFYYMGWLALGAAMVERFDLVESVANCLTELQDPQSGVILVHEDDTGEEIGDLCFSAGAGMGIVAAGKTEQAQMLAERLAAVVKAQLGERRMFTRFRGDGSVVARVKDHPRDVRFYDLDKREPQVPVYFATTLNMLIWTSRLTRDNQYLLTAQQLLDFVYSDDRDVAQSYRATKLGWSMLNLYEDTADENILGRAKRMGEAHVSRQSEDGIWDPDGKPNLPQHERLDYSADCAVTLCALANLPK